MLRMGLLATVYLCVLACNVTAWGSEGDRPVAESVKSIVDAVRANSPGHGGRLSDLCNTRGEAAISALIPYLDDGNPDVRLTAVYAMGKVQRAQYVPLIARKLQDGDDNVRYTAMYVLRQYPRESLMYDRDLVINSLACYLKELNGFSGDIVLFIADLDGKSKIKDIRLALAGTDAIEKRGWIDSRGARLSTMRDSMYAALLKLGDREAERVVLAALKQTGDVKRLTFGMGSAAYARRNDMLPLIMPLLDDTRDAMRMMHCPDGKPSFVKVRDVAVNAVLRITGLSVPFGIAEDQRNYTDSEIGELRARLVEGTPARSAPMGLQSGE